MLDLALGNLELGAATPGQLAPPEIAGCFMWFRSDLGITIVSGDVSAWADFSGQGNDASQPTPADRPAYGATSGVNGRPGVTFDASNTEWLSLGTVANASNDWTIIAVYNQLGLMATGQSLLASSTPAVLAAAETAAPAQVGGFDGSWRRAGAIITGEQWIEWHWNSSGSTLSTYRNGTLLTSVAYSGTIPMSGAAAIGRFPTGGFDANLILSELIVYDRSVTTELPELRADYLSPLYAL